MRIIVTGANGQLGHDLLKQRPDAVGTDLAASPHVSSPLDLTDGPAVQAFFEEVRPDVVIHGAAYTAVDKAESAEELAHQVNAVGSAHVASAAAAVGAGVIAVSTDYVFDGTATVPYEPTDPTGPTGAYGRTKLAGELAVRELLPDASWVVRTAWVWGAGGGNIIKTALRLAKDRDTLGFVDDQWGSPTYTVDLASGLLELADRHASVAPGTYHLTGGGATTWCRFVRAAFEENGLDPARVNAITTADYPTPATRPAYSVLSPKAWVGAGLTPLRPWREALAAAFADADTAAALRG